MRILLKPINILILSLIVLSCNDATKKVEDLKTFDLTSLSETSTLNLSDLGFKDIKYIALETTDSSLIQRKYSPLSFYKILSGNGFFIIRQFTTVLKFRDDGSFIRKIGTVGRGPGEFQVCHDIDVDELGRIYIVDAWKEKFFKYSQNGDLIKTFASPLERKSVEFIYFEGKFLCYNQNAQADVVNSFNVIDTNGTFLKSFPNKYPFTRHEGFGFNHENIFYRFNNQTFKKEIYCDTVFKFDNLTFRPHIVLQVGNKLITPEIRSKTDGLDISKNYISPLNLFEFGSYVYYEFTREMILFKDTKVYGFIGSKNDDFETLIDAEKGMVNDLDGGPNITPITTKDDNTIIAMIEAMELKNYIASETFKNSNPKYPEKKEKLEKFANTLKETDNPLLILISFNKIE
ncbi:MAG: 6-bladed beta-propeller [Bacteroidales bacterium]|nr:6-bladed beta-propeller [Bacteroidales bacterium]